MHIDKKTFWFIVIPIIVLSPMILSSILNIPTGKYAIGDENAWVGFFGNYSGGIIGGIIAFVIAHGQIKAQRDEHEKNDREKSRSYIVLEEFIGPLKLNNVITHNNSKILSNKFYDQIQQDPRADQINIAFFKIHHSGHPEMILDCDIRVSLFGEGDRTSPYIIETHLSVLEKGTEIFIPLANKKFNYIYPNWVRISYKTIKNERILYEYNVGEMVEKHSLINKDETRTKLYEVHLKGVEWIYPAKIKKEKDLNRKVDIYQNTNCSCTNNKNRKRRKSSNIGF